MLYTLLLLYMLFINVVALIMYGVDKYKAVHSAWRISERVLLLVALIGGAMGAMMGMYLFRHKTRHARFVVLVPLFLVAQLYLVYLLLT